MNTPADHFTVLRKQLRMGDPLAADAVCHFFHAELVQAAQRIDAGDSEQIAQDLCDQLLWALQAFDTNPQKTF